MAPEVNHLCHINQRLFPAMTFDWPTSNEQTLANQMSSPHVLIADRPSCYCWLSRVSLAYCKKKSASRKCLSLQRLLLLLLEDSAMPCYDTVSLFMLCIAHKVTEMCQLCPSRFYPLSHVFINLWLCYSQTEFKEVIICNSNIFLYE